MLLSFGAGEVGALDDDEPVDGEALDDELLSEDAGGVLELDDDALGDVLDGDVVLDDGGVVLDDDDDGDDVDGDGVTTGGVVPDVVEDSRLQPAMPSTSPVQSSVTNALFIAISR